MWSRNMLLKLKSKLAIQYLKQDNPFRLSTYRCLRNMFSESTPTRSLLEVNVTSRNVTATATKTSLENKHLRNGNFCLTSHPLLLTGHAGNGLVQPPLKRISRLKDLLLCVHVVVKTLNLEIPRWHLTDYVKELFYSMCRTCSTIIFPHLTNEIIVFWRRHCCCRHPRLSSQMSLSKHSENVIWKRNFAFLQLILDYSKKVCLQNVF